MNSEELEKSLRTEFESHLKSVLADMRQEFSEFQEKIEAEFDKHKSQLDMVFQDFSTRFETSRELDIGFKETVVEHLRLARDEGARITATAMTEAEEMEKQYASSSSTSSSAQHLPPSVGVSELRDAINDITAQTSQGTILKALVEQASQFTPRGAFFIIKNEHFVGWRVFGKEDTGATEETVRDILIPLSASTVLGESVRSLSATETSYGTYDSDAEYLNKLEFGQPDRMIAIPLVARGRGVAVLYADYGTGGEAVNVEALETLVRVAGLTVEVLASSSAQQSARPAQEAVQPAVSQTQETASVSTDAAREEVADATEVEVAKSFQSDSQSEESVSSESKVDDVQPSEMPTAEMNFQSETAADDLSSAETTTASQDVFHQTDRAETTSETNAAASMSESSDAEEAITLSESDIQVDSKTEAESEAYAPAKKDYQFEQTKTETAEEAAARKVFESFSSEDSTKTQKTVSEPATSQATATPVARSRFSDRNVDLPIEVGEDERRLHNDARRFARLLVSEIKLYNEQKVKEGREAQDLYERLREAIDRSRDMYDKRVQPPVAAKFDYFHYELVSTLAEGEETKLGGDYPGAAI